MTGSIIGYARDLTSGQDASSQVQALRDAGAVRVFVDTAAGASAGWPQLRATLDHARPGDVLAVWRLDRLGRSLPDLIAQVRALEAAGVGLRSLTEAIDTTTPDGRSVFHVFAVLAQFERQLLSERTRAGLDAARAEGRVGGRPSVMTTERTRDAARMRAGGMSLEAIAAVLGVGRSSVSRALVRYAEDAPSSPDGSPGARGGVP